MKTQEQIRDEFDKLSHILSRIEGSKKVHEYDKTILDGMISYWKFLAGIMEVPAFILNGWDIQHTRINTSDDIIKALES